MGVVEFGVHLGRAVGHFIDFPFWAEEGLIKKRYFSKAFKAPPSHDLGSKALGSGRLYSRSQKVGNPIASNLKSNV